MSKKIEQAVEAALQSPVQGMGYELCDVEYKKEDDVMVLTLFIFKPEGISLEDCENVSRFVDPILDELDPIVEPYYLSVSSLGLDRAFKRERDFERALGSAVEIRLYAPILAPGAGKKDKKKIYQGILKAVDENSLTLEVSGEDIVFEQKAVASARPHIIF